MDSQLSQSFDGLSPIIERFERAWHQGKQPSIDDYVAEQRKSSHRLLVEMVHADLEFRLKAGEPARVEEYVERYPELSSDSATLVDLLSREFELRRRTDLALSLDEYRTRWPDHAAVLAERFATTKSDENGLSTTTADIRRAQHAGDAVASTIDAPPTDRTIDSLTPGHTSGDYEILSELGAGGMGVVYKARQRSLKRLVALKTIRAGEFANADQILRFQAEAQSVARLNHPGIVPVYEVGIYRGLHFFSMQYLPGGSLSDRLKEGPLPARDGAVIVRQVAEAVQAAHDQQLIHRDLKPGNILLDEQGVPRVTDFGLAKQLDGDQGLTQTGDVMGTPSYMAPEQAQGQLDQIGSPTDVYALGAILYHILTGRPPFQGATKIETLRQVVEQEPAPPRQLNSAIPRDLETIALKCLRKEADKRYATSAELAADLGRWLENKPIVARPVSFTEKSWLWCKRRPTVAASIGIVLAVLLGSGIGVAAIRGAAAKRQTETEVTASREKAATAVQAHFVAPATAVPYTLELLKPLQEYAVPLLQAKSNDEAGDNVERLHAAYGLAELSDAPQTFLLDVIPEAPTAECSNIVTALKGVKTSALPELTQRAGAATEPLAKFRYAVVALQLGDVRLAQESLALRENPIDRTTLIHNFASWHGDLSEIARMLTANDDAAFRSGLCAALGLTAPDSIPSAERDVVIQTLVDLYTQAPDGGTHSAAGWALRQWKQKLPEIAATTQPPAGRQWYVNRQAMTMLNITGGGKLVIKSRWNPKYGSVIITDKNAEGTEVTIARSFLLADREVSATQFRQFLIDAEYPAAEKPEHWMPMSQNLGYSQPDQPAANLNWIDVVLYCNWLSIKEGLSPAYAPTGEIWKWKGDMNKERVVNVLQCDITKDGYRLPTEVEWEYACRAMTTSEFCIGDDEDLMMQYGWFVANSKRTCHSVGAKLPNSWGLFDMYGNLEEWCDDIFVHPGDATDTSFRMLRGGSFSNDAANINSKRDVSKPEYGSMNMGFRPARTYP